MKPNDDWFSRLFVMLVWALLATSLVNLLQPNLSLKQRVTATALLVILRSFR